MFNVITSEHLFTLLCVLAATSGQQYHGILINGVFGTQLYDPFNSPHATAGFQLGLQSGLNAMDGAAVINGPLAYFNSGIGGIRQRCFLSHCPRLIQIIIIKNQIIIKSSPIQIQSPID
jgi:hypothetical protein